MLLLVLTVLGALSISFLCSILEAALLSTREADLSQRASSGDQGAARLLAIKRDQIDDAISAILTLNTVAHTIGAAVSGAQAAVVFGDQWVGVFSGVLTILILVITEIIPKTVGTVYASALANVVGRTLASLIWVMRPALYLTRALTRLVSHGHKNHVTRGELLAMVQMAADEGTLDDSEVRVVSNLLKFDDIPVTSIMTPRTVMVALQADTPLRQLYLNEKARIFSRIPLYEGGDKDQIVGYVLMRDALRTAAYDPEAADEGARNKMRPVRFVPQTTSVAQVMRTFLTEKEHLAIVVDEHGGVSGLVTLEDVVETVLGVEITDEFDDVADLRQLAQALREKRLQRIENLRRSLEGERGEP